ncbi:hypothetical protein BURK_032864 [Burkholderia sp. SJ98]|nr:hypothetical protein BURK_032864 [Burkholderia sp. SJ98]
MAIPGMIERLAFEHERCLTRQSGALKRACRESSEVQRTVARPLRRETRARTRDSRRSASGESGS